VNDFDTIPPSPSTVQEVLNRAQKHCDSHRLPTAFEDCSSSLAERRWGKSLQWDDGIPEKSKKKGGRPTKVEVMQRNAAFAARGETYIPRNRLHAKSHLSEPEATGGFGDVPSPALQTLLPEVTELQQSSSTCPCSNSKCIANPETIVSQREVIETLHNSVSRLKAEKNACEAELETAKAVISSIKSCLSMNEDRQTGIQKPTEDIIISTSATDRLGPRATQPTTGLLLPVSEAAPSVAKSNLTTLLHNFEVQATSRGLFQYEVDGIKFYMKKSLEQLDALDRNACGHDSPLCNTKEGWFPYLRNLAQAMIDAELQRFWAKYNKIEVNADGCRETNATHALSHICPAWTTNCSRIPKTPRNARKNWKRLPLPFGGADRRIRRGVFALLYAKDKNWLGLAMMLLACDETGKPMHISHYCRTMREGWACWSTDHARLETYIVNNERSTHQSGAVLCKCFEAGRPPCLMNGRNIPIRDEQMDKILRWEPLAKTG
jgi:hypothetical protein